MKKRLSLIAVIAATAFVLAACQQKAQTASQEAQQAASPATSQAAAPATAPATAPAPARASRAAERAAASTPAPAPAAPAAPPKPAFVTYTIPAGTPVVIRLDNTVSSHSAVSGSSFTGTLASSLRAGGHTVVPAGSQVTGHVTNAVSSGRLNRPAELALTLDSLTPRGGNQMDITTNTLSSKGSSHKKRNGVMIGGGAGVGALIGALAGKGKGAAIGGLIGAGAGTAGAAATGRKEITLPAETRLNFVLSAPVTIRQRASSASSDSSQ